ncbi:hypothetical protein RD792_003573 [Penstemon davidsonii]|uniref:Anaphase-promoting complex subunit 4 WD40 domain-containing protein n=1 Tax=Penstemon davidsonii TaxID=160366 RepID=A0ABR0DF48_9LAMI|nr:hypothetical protein RD792_003573 [Penstemon davidsonii]
MDTAKLLLAASGGDTVKLFDISVEPQNPCILAYSPSPGLRVNSVKWNHNNLVLASAGEDSKISLWNKSGQSLWIVPAKNSRGEIVEPSESVSTINFSNKGSRYLCSGGSGQVVRIWDLQNRRCVKWLKGHTDTITGVMYNCKDEHIAFVSHKGDLILHNLSSGTKAAELRDPNGQVAYLFPCIFWLRLVMMGPFTCGIQLVAAQGISFSPTNDKIIASVGLDMKLYTFDSGSRKPSSCIPYEAPFSSLAFTDDGLTLAAGTSTGQVVFYDVRGKPQPITVLRAYGNSESLKHDFLHQAVTNLCWQRSKPVIVNEHNCTDENVLLAGDVGDSVLMPDPLPSRALSSLSMTSGMSGSQNPGRSSSSYLPGCSGSASRAYSLTSSEVTPLRSSLLTGGALARLNAPRSYNFKDDMEVFSPLVEVQPITPSLDKSWVDHDGPKKDEDRKPSFLFLLGGLVFQRTGPMITILCLTGNLTHHPNRQTSNQETPIVSSEALSSPLATKNIITGQNNLDTLGPALSFPRRLISYAERIGATPSLSDASPFQLGSPKSKKTGTETREELLTNTHGEVINMEKNSLQSESQQGTSFTLQLFQRTLEETHGSLQNSIPEDERNLHIFLLRVIYLILGTYFVDGNFQSH